MGAGFYPGQALTNVFAENADARADAARQARVCRELSTRAGLATRRFSGALASAGAQDPAQDRSGQVLASDWTQRTITVIAVPYGEPALVPFRGEVWREIFDRRAFVNAVEVAEPDRVRVNRGHNKSDGVGKVVHFDPTDRRGLVARISVARTLRGDDTLGLAVGGALSASLGFGVLPGGEKLDHTTKTRVITRAFIDHLALVESPAYRGAQVLEVRGGARTLSVAAAREDPILRWAQRRVRGW